MAREIVLRYGGPVEPGRGFVLHSDDYADDTTVAVTADVSHSAGFDVLKLLARGQGPSRVLVVLGYSGWAAQQLESELDRDDWLTAHGRRRDHLRRRRRDQVAARLRQGRITAVGPPPPP